jgi:hypothetical protein
LGVACCGEVVKAQAGESAGLAIGDGRETPWEAFSAVGTQYEVVRCWIMLRSNSRPATGPGWTRRIGVAAWEGLRYVRTEAKERNKERHNNSTYVLIIIVIVQTSICFGHWLLAAGYWKC